MRKLDTKIIEEALSKMCLDTVCNLPEDVVATYSAALKNEASVEGKDLIKQLINNSNIAKKEQIPTCQDTGMAVVFVDIGSDVILTGKPIEDAINKGIAKGYVDGKLRKSVVRHPLDRVNTENNAPAVIYYNIVEGEKLKISFMPKGFGSENMSALTMLKPSDGREGVINFIVKTVEKAGPDPCPPLFIGVGIGGTADKAMIMAKRALLRKPGVRSKVEIDCHLEKELIKKINKTGIGPGGLGGTVTAFEVFVESFPTHIAGLPVAVNICCHALRHKEISL